MADLILINPKIIAENTILSGNTDVDKYVNDIFFVQEKYIREMLGDLLYNKISNDYENDTLTGDYLILYNDFVVPIIKYQTISEYVETASVVLDNTGAAEINVDNRTQVDVKKIHTLKSKYATLSQVYIDRFEKWIINNNLTEYTQGQEGVNPQTDINTSFAWHL